MLSFPERADAFSLPSPEQPCYHPANIFDLTSQAGYRDRQRPGCLDNWLLLILLSRNPAECFDARYNLRRKP
jgi:hypothetical protein